jgi:AcrR family transcriptional regulator
VRAGGATVHGAPPRGVRSPRVQVSEMQRLRLLRAAVAAVEELGYANATVAQITTLARVSRRTFYDLFANREDCLLAVIEDAVARVEHEFEEANLTELPWVERLRTGLWLILCYFDSEPALARLCVIQSARGSQRVLERREQLLASLALAVDAGRGESSNPEDCQPLIAEGLVGAALSIIYSRLLKRDPEPLSGLLGELMGMLALPYLGSALARAERARPVPALVAQTPKRRYSGEWVAQSLPMRLTYRTALVLETVEENPGVSNRRVGEEVGVADPGQLSRLLSRLEGLGLLQNTGRGHSKGEPNAWRLTPTGQKVTQSIRTDGRYASKHQGNDTRESN